MKRNIAVYEAVDKNGATIAFAATIPAIRKFVDRNRGETYKTTVVPLRPAELCEFLTTYAGGAGA